jgi:hypothetical protein
VAAGMGREAALRSDTTANGLVTLNVEMDACLNSRPFGFS